MPFTLRRWPQTALLFVAASSVGLTQNPIAAEGPRASKLIEMAQYSVLVEPGNPPRLTIERDHQAVFVVPVVAGLGSSTQ
jgi:hypothetical protein